MARKIRLGISTCPNDTFAFHALMRGLVDLRGYDFEIQLLDIQQLNRLIFDCQLEIAKASFHAGLLVTDAYVVLPSGSALGFGVGPLLLASHAATRPAEPHQLTLCPGEHTTAHLLFRLFHANTTRVEQVVFSDIMPRLQRRSADFGVCIHEGRFTWPDAGLHLVEDLGSRWERETGCPLPLGGILGRRDLGPAVLQDVQSVIADSLAYARALPECALVTMRQYAQEMGDDVLMQHVQLYVNDWTTDLGRVGRDALNQLWKRAVQAGMVQAHGQPLEVFS
jgi:1,4-dihydroxy-6-naphthoate synthase